MFRHVHAHQHLYWALIGKRGGTLMLGWFREILTELVAEELDTGRAPDAPPLDVVVQFVVGAYLSLLTWWIDNGAHASPEEMDRHFRALATSAVLPGHRRTGR
ncbi:TetR-like C-terminal domain-containing protein [Longispora sp. K20-0274]|uniref:TetR-like C-terminal domain-containing protein n=1 Tax=Longispora sp. K20-0274 TaxID=3088255 RepID=UPI003999BA89